MSQKSPKARQKAALLNELRTAHQSGEGFGASSALSQRELSARYGLSARTISLLLQQLVEEGVLYTVPRVGTFLGRPQCDSSDPFLIIRSDLRFGAPESLMQSGFEERIGQLGGVSWPLSPQEAKAYQEKGELGALKATFQACSSEQSALYAPNTFAGVRVGPPSNAPMMDGVVFDDIYGGSQATQHLLQMGHRNIAFLALHAQGDENGKFFWSAQRERGWHETMGQIGREVSHLAFHPPQTPQVFSAEQLRAARNLATAIVKREDISAVIIVNGLAVQSFLDVLMESGLPSSKWPAMVCFDSGEWSDSVVSCLQLPWEKVGIEAAQILWERRSGRLTGAPIQRKVPMRLLPRLTCRPDWANFNLARLRALESMTKLLSHQPIELV